MEGSVTTQGPTPQATIPPDVSAFLDQPTPNRREERI